MPAIAGDAGSNPARGFMQRDEILTLVVITYSLTLLVGVPLVLWFLGRVER